MIGSYCCRPHCSSTGPEEYSQSDDIVLPRSGLFVKHVRGKTVVADANQVVFFNRGESYRVSHPLTGGDDCTTFTLSRALLRDLLRRYDPDAADRSTNPFSVSHGPSEKRAFFLHSALLRALIHERVSTLAVEENVLGLLDTLLPTALRERRRPGDAERPATLRAHRDIVHAVLLAVAERCGPRLCLGDLSRLGHCSPYHLARLFKRTTGVSIHRYRTQLRLRRALGALIDGERDLTALALSLGFFDHSHFSNAFQRAFGMAPSQFRHLHPRRLKEMSKNLQV